MAKNLVELSTPLIENMTLNQLLAEKDYYISRIEEFVGYPAQIKASKDQIAKIDELIKVKKMHKVLGVQV